LKRLFLTEKDTKRKPPRSQSLNAAARRFILFSKIKKQHFKATGFAPFAKTFVHFAVKIFDLKGNASIQNYLNAPALTSPG
jgi:hypothetical protein